MKCSIIVIFSAILVSVVSAKKVHYIHWNRNNPMFRIDNTDHIVDVNRGNLPWEYDQVNVICPVSKPGSRYPEKHVIYSVSKEEFDSCRITNPKPRIVAICNKPHRLMYFTITFRSFTPTPGGLEFLPGQDYYFISTSSREDLHRRVGGGCSTHNMKMIFKVHDNRHESELQSLDDNLQGQVAEHADQINVPREIIEEEKPHSSLSRPSSPLLNSNNNRQQADTTGTGEYIYYYHPRDLSELENTISVKKRINLDLENDL